MLDPFLPQALAEKRQRWIGAIALLTFLILIAFVFALVSSGDQTPVEASVMKIGSYPTEEGEKPLVMVRLDDGSTRQIISNRPAIVNCVTGSRILLLRGRIWRVSRHGCLPR